MQLINGDCLEMMKSIPDDSVDMILCDLPYGQVRCAWDVIIPFEPLWEQYKRIVKGSAAIVLFGSQPFTSKLVLSNLEWFKYEWIYNKTKGVGYLNSKRMPITNHENVLVFSSGKTMYNPQFSSGIPYKRIHRNEKDSSYGKSSRKNGHVLENDGFRYPTTSISAISNPSGRGQLHHTQKPVALCEYLIKTYTKEGETILDNCMGSGTTGIACLNTGRNFIGIEKDEAYFKIATDRINNHRLEGKSQDAIAIQ